MSKKLNEVMEELRQKENANITLKHDLQESSSAQQKAQHDMTSLGEQVIALKTMPPQNQQLINELQEKIKVRYTELTLSSKYD